MGKDTVRFKNEFDLSSMFWNIQQVVIFCKLLFFKSDFKWLAYLLYEIRPQIILGLGKKTSRSPLYFKIRAIRVATDLENRKNLGLSKDWMEPGIIMELHQGISQSEKFNYFLRQQYTFINIFSIYFCSKKSFLIKVFFFLSVRYQWLGE